ncbi:MAG TPA: hypothetical protein VH325_00520 [Bryobacteraceae bacterium]|nr:hypothetical protein [Bryobacteraceae bacterium]
MALDSLPPGSSGPQGTFAQRLEGLAAAGFFGVQFAALGTADQLGVCRALKLGAAASGRVNTPEEASPLAERIASDGYECATLHVGWGLEDDSTAAGLIDSVLEASQKWSVPLYIETHRATICQDMWRTVGFAQRFPQMRFNGDFSHWYAGQEMVYGGFEKKLAFIAPVLERIRFLHGRIASPGCIQIAIRPNEDPAPPYVDHFQRLWTESFRGFLRNAAPGDFICFTPELLGPEIYYARTFGSQEESDRWEQSLILKKIAEQCFSHASSC